MRVVVVGAGGHAAVVGDAILAMQAAGRPLELTAFVDLDVPSGRTLLGKPVLEERLSEVAHDALVVAIGDNKRRHTVFLALAARGERFVTIIHPRATVAREVTIGDGAVLLAGAIVNTGTVIGPNAILNTGSSVDHHNRIGSHAHIAPGAHLGGNVVIGDGVLVGLGASVLPGCTVGDWAIVGGGSTVISTVGEQTTVVGMPARPQGRVLS